MPKQSHLETPCRALDNDILKPSALEIQCRAQVRDHAMIVLHKSLVTAGESLHLSADTWGITWADHVLPMVQTLSSAAAGQEAEAGAHEMAHSLNMAINTVSQTYLAHMDDLMQLRDWRGLWLATLQVLRPFSYCRLPSILKDHSHVTRDKGKISLCRVKIFFMSKKFFVGVIIHKYLFTKFVTPLPPTERSFE